MIFQVWKKIFLHSMTFQVLLNDFGRGGHLGLIVMRLFKAYAPTKMIDIDRFNTRYS